jgi:hypothetical protein
MVLDAVTAGRLHILTDELVADMVARRAQRILDALPSALDS